MAMAKKACDAQYLVKNLREAAESVPNAYDRHLMTWAADRIKELEMQVEELHARIDVLER